jgi:hypothetical protein
LVSDMGRHGFDRMRSPRAAAMIALASATGQARTLPASRTGAGDDALLDAVPDAVGLALQRPGQLGDLHHGPEIGGDRGLGVLELPVG